MRRKILFELAKFSSGISDENKVRFR